MGDVLDVDSRDSIPGFGNGTCWKKARGASAPFAQRPLVVFAPLEMSILFLSNYLNIMIDSLLRIARCCTRRLRCFSYILFMCSG